MEQGKDHCCSDVFAFVTVLWGTSSKHCLDALVLGMSLRLVRTQHDMVLLHTSDVPSCWLQVLQRFWELRLVRHLESRGLYNGGSGGRFEHVFTKLHVFNLTDYDKVVLLDGDMILLKNVDHLFKREAPAALRRHAGADFGDDERINGEDFWNHRGELSNGINAGVILLEPSRADFQIMCKEISDEGHCEHSVSGMPEQDYLTRYFVDRWRSLGVQYNFQLHQVAFTNRRRLETCTRLVTEYEDIFIVHFSGKVGPRDFLLANECYKMSSLKCAEYLVQIYKPLMGRQGSGRLGPYPIEAQLRSFTYLAVASWFELWTRLLQECPNLEEIVTAHRQAATGELRMVLSAGSRQTRTKGRPGKGRPGVRSGPVS